MRSKETLQQKNFLAASPSEVNVQQQNYLGFPNMQRLKSAKHRGHMGSIGKSNKSRELAASEHTLQLCNVYLDQNNNGLAQLMNKRDSLKRFKPSPSTSVNRDKLFLPASL